MYKRFIEVREKLGFTKTEFAEELGIKSFNIRDMESGKQKIPIELAEILEEKFSINGWWLLTGKGEMLEKDNNFEDLDIDSNIKSSLVSITYFKDTYAAAGAGAINYDNAPMVMAFDRDFLRVQLGISVFKHIHIIHAIGNSMYPTIQTGEMLFVNPFENEDFKIRDKDIYVINTPSGVLVKRIKIENPITKEYSLISDNPKDKDIPLAGDDFNSCTIVGRVIGHFNKL